MKNKIICLLVCGLVLMCGCGAKTETANGDGISGENTSNNDDSSKDKEESVDNTDYTAIYTEAIIAEAGGDAQNVRYSLVDDFDKDGQVEGFFFVGGEPDEEWNSCDGEIWFAGVDGCRMIHDYFSFYLIDGNVFRTVLVGDKTFVLFDDMYTTSSVTNIYYVENSTYRESVTSRLGSAYYDADKNELSITLSVYDHGCDYDAGSDEPMWTGHTWKPYYFYYDGSSGDFREFGATEITAKELESICGEDLAGSLEAQGYTVDRIIKRDNGIVNVNYSKVSVGDDGSKSIDYKNATYDERKKDYVNAWGDEETGVEASDYGGIYELHLLN